MHYQHGVGRYDGMVKRSIGGVERDYLLLEYKGGDKLYVPSDQIDAVRQYVGGESPTLHRLGGSRLRQGQEPGAGRACARSPRSWSCSTRSGVHTPGHAFGPDTPWQREMEEAFPYVETPDQRTAIADVKDDMETPYPMDRLVCGDVGFGKTEVAIRAAFKAIQDGKQVAVLVPTTLLAQQHHAHLQRALRRLPDPGRGALPLPHPRAGQGRGRGHRAAATSTASSAPTACCRSDVQFKDLGLLVVDEEQRFGVQHKEADQAAARPTWTCSPSPPRRSRARWR